MYFQISRMGTQVLAAIIILLSSIVSVGAQSNNPAWTDKFSEQLANEQECEVAFFTTLVETTKNGQNFYSGRAHCVDGRQFDGERTGDKDPFVIKACKVVVC